MTQAQIESLHERYRNTFAGRSRATRDLGVLDGLIAEATALASGADAAGRALLDERLSLYRGERAAIAEIQAGGPAVVEAWRVAEWSELDNYRYGRHFAGKDRRTRDRGLLLELAADERARLDAIPDAGNPRLAARKEQIAANARLYTSECAAIADARAALAPTEEARLLATLANQQFEHWRQSFEGRNRATRRVALLERMIAALDEVRGRMVAVREMGVSSDANLANIKKVTERIAFWRDELARIRTARAAVSGADLARRLGQDANEIFQVYRKEFAGKARNALDHARLGVVCDQLHEAARTMRALQIERPSDVNGRNLAIVLDHLRVAEREHVAIADARPKG